MKAKTVFRDAIVPDFFFYPFLITGRREERMCQNVAQVTVSGAVR